MNNIQLLKKAGPILGLIVSLSTTSFAGYKIFAAPLQHKTEVPSLPNPTPTAENEQEEIVETIIVDESASVTGTPTPKVTPVTSARGSGTVSLGGSTGSTGVRGREVEDDEDEDRDSDHEREFDDDNDDTLTIKQEDHEDEHETPEPTQKPESH